MKPQSVEMAALVAQEGDCLWLKQSAVTTALIGTEPVKILARNFKKKRIGLMLKIKTGGKGQGLKGIS